MPAMIHGLSFPIRLRFLGCCCCCCCCCCWCCCQYAPQYAPHPPYPLVSPSFVLPPPLLHCCPHRFRLSNQHDFLHALLHQLLWKMTCYDRLLLMNETYTLNIGTELHRLLIVGISYLNTAGYPPTKFHCYLCCQTRTTRKTRTTTKQLRAHWVQQHNWYECFQV